MMLQRQYTCFHYRAQGTGNLLVWQLATIDLQIRWAFSEKGKVYQIQKLLIRLPVNEETNETVEI